ncbi:hypothetical protein ACWCXX_28240 [Streptomyces sp. NPDC001732]
MNGIAPALRAVHRGERWLAENLVLVAERHRSEHEVHHVAMDLARWSEEHCLRVAEAGARYGPVPDGPPSLPVPGPAPAATKDAADRPELVPLLLRDLVRLHLGAVENSLHWEMLAQAAQAVRDAELLRLVTTCHSRTLRQMRWSNTLIKNLSPQALTAT